MTHLDFENLAADYLDGALDVVRRTQAEAHLASCSECRSMIESVQFAVKACHEARELEVPSRLVSRILYATTGDRKQGMMAELMALLKPVFRPQVVYGVSMALFSVSFVLFTARVNLRKVRIRDINPATWFQRADSRGHVLLARAEKFYYDLRFVYDVQSVLRELRQQPNAAPPKTGGRSGGNSEIDPPGGERLALAHRSQGPLLPGGAGGRSRPSARRSSQFRPGPTLRSLTS